jgi:hypothetical protein
MFTLMMSTGCGKSGNENLDIPVETIEARDIRQDIPENVGTTIQDRQKVALDSKSLGNHASQNDSSSLEIRAPSGMRLAAVLSEGSGTSRAGFVLENGMSVIAYEGRNLSGYYVVSINPSPREVVLEKNSIRYLSKISGDDSAIRMSSAPASPASSIDYSSITTLDETVLGTLPREKFEPTDEETRRAIDPNNSATWPNDYRGPAIERALKSQSGR